jgi:hypothetical protein
MISRVLVSAMDLYYTSLLPSDVVVEGGQVSNLNRIWEDEGVAVGSGGVVEVNLYIHVYVYKHIICIYICI